MAGRAEAWAEIEAIKRLKARYFRMIDTRDFADFADLFTSDAEIDVREDAGDAGRITGGARFAAFVEKATLGARTVHHGHMPEIELIGPDSATGIWAMSDIVEFENGAGLRGYGHYRERYAKEAGVWRIAAMRLTRLRVDRFGGSPGAEGRGA